MIGQLHTAALYSNDDEVVGTPVELDYLHRHALQGALDSPRVEDGRGLSGHRCTNMAVRPN
jgi:hypothetical protein